MSELTASRIEKMIFIIRGVKVMLDNDLAELYGVETKNLNKAVKRNIERYEFLKWAQKSFNNFNYWLYSYYQL